MVAPREIFNARRSRGNMGTVIEQSEFRENIINKDVKNIDYLNHAAFSL